MIVDKKILDENLQAQFFFISISSSNIDKNSSKPRIFANYFVDQ
ncbi:hypothetical protein FWK35_00004810, partial [Aphis craccivora]